MARYLVQKLLIEDHGTIVDSKWEIWDRYSQKQIDVFGTWQEAVSTVPLVLKYRAGWIEAPSQDSTQAVGHATD